MNKIFKELFEKYWSYFSSVYVDRLKNFELALKVTFLIIIVQFVIICLMITYTMKASNEKTIEVTLTKDTLVDGSKYVLERESASKNYFETIAYGVLHELTTYDYLTIQNKVNYALGLVHPKKYLEVYDILKKESNFAIENRVNQEFKIKDWTYKQINSSTAEIKAMGYLTRKVGGILVIDDKKYNSSVIIKIKNGLPFVYGLDLNYSDKIKDAKEREERLNEIENLDRKNYEGIKNDKKK